MSKVFLDPRYEARDVQESHPKSLGKTVVVEYGVLTALGKAQHRRTHRFSTLWLIKQTKRVHTPDGVGPRGFSISAVNEYSEKDTVEMICHR